MDVVTHGITGVLVSRALPSGHRGSMMAAGLLGALAPDVDVVARIWDPMAAITVHRTATHSFLGGVIVALVVASSVRAFSNESFVLLFGVAYVGLLSHIGLDLLTSFGTAILWPLASRRFALAQHYLIDPIFSTIALVFLIMAFKVSERSTSLARMGIAAILLYVALAGVHQRMASSRWQELTELKQIRPIRSAVLPLFPGPFRWLGLSETEKGFYQQPFRLSWIENGDP